MITKDKVGLYKNPRNLNGFSDDCRGVLLANGEFYVAQNLNALHYNIIELLVEKGILPQGSIQYEDKPPTNFVAVQRFDNSRTFTQSSAYEFDSPNYYKNIFDIGNQKQSYFNFEFYKFEMDFGKFRPLKSTFLAELRLGSEISIVPNSLG